MTQSKNTNSVEITENIKKLFLNPKKSDLQNIKNISNFKSCHEIFSNYSQINFSKVEKRINSIEDKLMEICEHKWEYDCNYGMYDKPDKICRLCESRIIRF